MRDGEILNGMDCRLQAFKATIDGWAKEMGFDRLGVCRLGVDESTKDRFDQWLSQGYAGEMAFLKKNRDIRFSPEKLLPGTTHLIMVSVNAFPAGCFLPQAKYDADRANLHAVKGDRSGIVATYALGRDYHKIVRSRLKRLVGKMQTAYPDHRFRICCDSAPLLEVDAATRAGLGWRGKNSLLINRQQGSAFVLGSVLTDLPLEVDEAIKAGCGTCRRCQTICPTQAIVGDYYLDARRCISYLTIEHRGVIPVEFRQAMGQRIFGCDDCQLHCPWNRFAQAANLADFDIRQPFLDLDLLKLFSWTESEFKANLCGTALNRLSYGQWQRNVAIALGNLGFDERIVRALSERVSTDPVVAEHIDWAITQQLAKKG